MANEAATENPISRRTVSPAEWGRMHGLTRATCHNLIKRGELESYKIGRSRRIPIDALPKQPARSDHS